jgi:hypothetical protein
MRPVQAESRQAKNFTAAWYHVQPLGCAPVGPGSKPSSRGLSGLLFLRPCMDYGAYGRNSPDRIAPQP